MKKGIKKFISIFIRVCITWWIVRFNTIDFGVKTSFDKISFILTIYSLISYYIMIASLLLVQEHEIVNEQGVRYYSRSPVVGFMEVVAALIFPLIFIALLIGGIPALIGLFLPDNIKEDVQIVLAMVLLTVPVFKDIYDVWILFKPKSNLVKKEDNNKKTVSQDCNLYGPNEDMTYEEYQRYLEEK